MNAVCLISFLVLFCAVLFNLNTSKRSLKNIHCLHNSCGSKFKVDHWPNLSHTKQKKYFCRNRKLKVKEILLDALKKLLDHIVTDFRNLHNCCLKLLGDR